MAKLKLNPNPTFVRKITVPIPEGGEGDVMLTYKYRTRTEMAEFSRWLVDTKAPEYPAIRELKEGETYSDEERAQFSAALIEYSHKVIEWDAELLMQFVVGWDLDAEFNRDNLRTFLNTNHRDFRQIALDDYIDAQTRAKLGN